MLQQERLVEEEVTTIAADQSVTTERLTRIHDSEFFNEMVSIMSWKFVLWKYSFGKNNVSIQSCL
jgi:hypothetical protein